MGQYVLVSDNDPVVIRRGQLSEIDAAVSVWLAANRGRDLPNHPDRLRTWAHGAEAVLDLVDDHGQLVGMALRLAGRTDDGAGAPVPGLCHLTGICVLPKWQGQHLGGRLLDEVLAVARQDRYVRATLWTHQHNPVLACSLRPVASYPPGGSSRTSLGTRWSTSRERFRRRPPRDHEHSDTEPATGSRVSAADFRS